MSLAWLLLSPREDNLLYLKAGVEVINLPNGPLTMCEVAVISIAAFEATHIVVWPVGLPTSSTHPLQQPEGWVADKQGE